MTSPSSLPAPDPIRPHGTAGRDGLIVLLVAAMTWGACAWFEFAELLARWAKPFERYQLDEMPTVLLVTAVALAWFSWRRHRETRRELAQRLRAETALRDTLESNRRLARHVIDAQENERRLLARELHDELGQYLNAIKLDAVALDAPPLPDSLHVLAAGIADNVSHVTQTVRTLIRRCRPVALDELGLTAALEHCVTTWRHQHPDVQFTFDADAGIDAGEPVALSVYRATQEALTNISRHAHARHVALHLHAHATDDGGSTLALDVHDDGIGCAPLVAPSDGLGLVGMRERIQTLGGTVLIDTAPTQGFRLHVRVPCAPLETTPA